LKNIDNLPWVIYSLNLKSRRHVEAANRRSPVVTHTNSSSSTPTGHAGAVTRSTTGELSKAKQQDKLKQSVPRRNNNNSNEHGEDGAGVVQVNSHPEKQLSSPPVTLECIETLHRRIENLASTVDKQNEIINNLTSQLGVVLRFLGITESCQPLGTLKTELSELRANLLLQCCQHPESPAPVAKASAPTAPSQAPTTGSVKDVLVAVHNEMRQQRRRRQNVVVSGLKPADGVDDADLFTAVCETCLPVKPAIVRDRCRRLGKQQPGKTRPYLAALTSEDNASELLQCAKLLKDSTAGAGIYINPDLTPAEAQAAFDRRQLRRQARSRQAGAHSAYSAAGDASARGRASNDVTLSASAASYVPSSQVAAVDVDPSASSSAAQVLTPSIDNRSGSCR
jgi:hypothetical protein